MICYQCASNTSIVQCERCARFYCDLHREHNCKVLHAERKLALPAQPSKNMLGLPYPGNPADYCSRICMVWLLAKTSRKRVESSSDSTDRVFYEASSKMPTTLNPRWCEDWMEVMEGKKLLPSGAMDESFIWSCENIFRTMILFRVVNCFSENFNIKIIELIRALAEYRDDQEAYIVIVSAKLNHAVAATIKIQKMWYHTIRFLDPNSISGEKGIRLPPVSDSWAERISALTLEAGFSPPANTDFTIISLDLLPNQLPKSK